MFRLNNYAENANSAINYYVRSHCVITYRQHNRCGNRKCGSVHNLNVNTCINIESKFAKQFIDIEARANR